MAEKAREIKRKKSSGAKKDETPATQNSGDESIAKKGEELKRRLDKVAELVEKALNEYIAVVGENFAFTYIQQGGE